MSEGKPETAQVSAADAAAAQNTLSGVAESLKTLLSKVQVGGKRLRKSLKGGRRRRRGRRTRRRRKSLKGGRRRRRGRRTRRRRKSRKGRRRRRR